MKRIVNNLQYLQAYKMFYLFFELVLIKRNVFLPILHNLAARKLSFTFTLSVEPTFHFEVIFSIPVYDSCY